MTLKVLSITDLRNFQSAQYLLHPTINIISGDNGVGKTSFLEAIHLLSCARSFRSNEIAPLVRNGRDSLIIYAELADNQTVAIKKKINSISLVKINDQICTAASKMAQLLPTQVFYQDIFQIVDAGPSERRHILDWGMFHVKHSYLDLVKQYRRVLKQRNSLLKYESRRSMYIPWDIQLSELSYEIDILRAAYLQSLQPLFSDVLAQISELKCNIQYYKGWGKQNDNRSLELVLEEAWEGDRQYQYTRFGSHHAELLFSSGSRKVKQYFSRGQQKLLLFALKLAQAQLYSGNVVFLMDDLFSELDMQHGARLIQYIAKTKGQFFITCHQSEMITNILDRDERERTYGVIQLASHKDVEGHEVVNNRFS